MNLRRSIILGQSVLLLSLFFPSSAPAQSQTASAAAGKIRDKVTTIGLQKEVTVRLNNKDVHHGTVEAVDNETFKIYDVDLKQVVEFKFAEVRKVEKGYGGRNILGQRVSPGMNHFGTVLGIAGAVLLVVFLHAGLKD
jgi:hypothetical protein